MFLTITICLLSSPSMLFALGGNSLPEASNISKRSPSSSVLKPKDLFLCSLNESRIAAQRSVCERTFELQQEAHHCASRRLLTMRIDHQLAHLQRAVLQTILRKAMQKASKCERHMEPGSNGVVQLREEISSLRSQQSNLQDYKSKVACVYPRLKRIRDTLQATNAKRKTVHVAMKNNLESVTEKVKNNDEKVNTFSAAGANETDKHIEASRTSLALTTCNDNLARLALEQLNCSVHTLPNLQENVRAKNESLRKMIIHRKTVQNNLTKCDTELLQCQASDVCGELQATTKQGSENRDEHRKVESQLTACISSLKSLQKQVSRCESSLANARRSYHDLLVNATTRRIQNREMENAIMQCETQVSVCQENVTVCNDFSAVLAEQAATCWQELDKWKFRTDLCTGQTTMLWQNINATDDYIGDMRAKHRADQAKLNSCHDRQLYHKSGHAQAVHVLSLLTPKLNETRASLAACQARCPQLAPTPSPSRCPPADHGLSWHQLPSGCFLVTRPGADHTRMRDFCGRQTPGAAIVRLSSRAMAEDAYAALLRRFLTAARSEPLRRQRRAWVNFADGFEFAGTPARSYQCANTACACWTMRFPWRGRSQLHTCEFTNLPAICYVPLAD